MNIYKASEGREHIKEDSRIWSQVTIQDWLTYKDFPSSTQSHFIYRNSKGLQYQ